MSGGYSNVFEQWLKKSSHEEDDDAKEELTFNDPEGIIADLIDSDFSCDEDGGSVSGRSPFYEPGWNGKAKQAASDLAPILVDDKNEVYPRDKHCFEDDPPILEPVAKSTINSKSPMVRHSSLDPQVPVNSYSRVGMVRSKSSEGKMTKTYGKTEDNCLKRSKESGNLFEKFIPLSSSNDDVPPPLIPSPEAMRLQSESPDHSDRTDRNHPSCSPDFRAMEADSTSEISGECAIVHVKSPVTGEVAVECDSTCMLGGSPAVVSPASVSNSESDMRDQCGSGIDADAGSPAEQARGANYTGEYVRSDPGFSLETEKSCDNEGPKLKTGNISHLPLLSLCPGANVTDASMSLPALLTSDLPQDEESMELVQDEPPVLCAIPAASPPVLCAIPAPITPQSISKKRHTIDSPYTYCSSDKKSRVCPKVEDEEDLDCSAPPLLPLMSDTIADKTLPKIQTKGIHSTSGNLQSSRACKKKHRRERKPRIRHNTVPTVDLVSDVSHLSEELQHFVVATSQLSALKSSVHSLLQTLFSQIKAELSTMSPESCKFEQFLKDIVESLQQGDKRTTDSNLPLTLTKKCDKDSGDRPIIDSQPSHKLRQSSDISIHINNSLAAQSLDVLCSSYEDPAASSSLYPPPSCNKRLTRQTTHKEDSLASELSKLDLKNTFLLRPLKVCVPRTCSNHLHKFCVLCCDLLQLLLPGLPLSLCSELSDSPPDLLTFVNNVLASNQKRKH